MWSFNVNADSNDQYSVNGNVDTTVNTAARFNDAVYGHWSVSDGRFRAAATINHATTRKLAAIHHYCWQLSLHDPPNIDQDRHLT